MTANVEVAAAPVVRTRAIAIPAIRVGALLPAAVYLAGQAATLLMVWYTAHVHHRSLHGLLAHSWDGRSFLAIAAHGYSHSTKAGVSNSIAFFPGYPAVIRAVRDATWMPLAAAAISVSVAAGIAFAYALTRLVSDRRTGLVLVGLAAVSPVSIVLLMAYSEALFCALAAWALVCMQRQRWLTAALLVALAGTVRQTGVALCVALAVAVILARPPRRDAWRPLAAVVIAPAGLVGYLTWVNGWTGKPAAWFHAEANGWGARFDFGQRTLAWSYRALIDAPAILDVATVFMLAAAFVLLGRLIQRRAAVFAVYAGVVVGMDVLSAGIMNSKVRLLVPAFVLLIPVAYGIARQPWRRMAWVFAVVAAGGVWYSAYALATYGYAI